MRRWLRDTAGGLPATYWYLWAGLLINRVGGFAVLFLSLYLTAQRGASTALAGVVVGTYGIGGVLGTLAGGVLTDRWGRRATLLWSHLAAAVTLATLALVTNLGTIAALCALLGLVQSMPGPAFVAAITDLVPADRRLRAFNLEFWAFNLGTAGASLVAGLLAEWSYTGLFLIDATSTFAAAAVIAWKVPETLDRSALHRGAPDRRTPDHSTPDHSTLDRASTASSTADHNNPDRITLDRITLDRITLDRLSTANSTADHGRPERSTPDHGGSGRSTPDHGRPERSASRRGGSGRRSPVAAPPARGGLGAVLTDRIFLVFAGLTLLQALVYTQTSTIVPLAMRADGLSPSAYGTVVALSGALIVVAQLFVPRLIDNRRKHRVLAFAQATTAVGFAALALADRLPAYLAAAAIWTIGSMLAAPPNAEINAELAPIPLRGRYQAVFYLTFPAAAFLAPTLGGAGLQYLGSAHWLVVAGVGLLGAALHLAAGPARERHTAKIRQQTTLQPADR